MLSPRKYDRSANARPSQLLLKCQQVLHKLLKIDSERELENRRLLLGIQGGITGYTKIGPRYFNP